MAFSYLYRILNVPVTTIHILIGGVPCEYFKLGFPDCNMFAFWLIGDLLQWVQVNIMDIKKCLHLDENIKQELIY